MSRIVLVLGACALFATGLGAGVVVSGGGSPDEAEAPAARVVYRTKDGKESELTVSEAAARIERLEAQIGRIARARAEVPEDDEEEVAAAEESRRRREEAEVANVPIPERPDGTRYSFAELREIARTSNDPVLRLAAIRALRRDTSPEARAALEEIVTDAKTPKDLRVEAAKAMAKPPHRDAAPDELVKLLAATDLPPDVRFEIADGVTRLRDRGAWMSEIAAQFGKETDPQVRGLLFESVARSAWDPAARDQLLGLLGNSATSVADAQLAVQALSRLGNDRKVLAALEPYLAHSDPVLREQAVLAHAKAGKLSPDEVSQFMSADTPGVRAASFSASLPPLPKNATPEQKAARQEILQKAAQTALRDPEPDVRRAALAWVGALRPELREKVLEGARSDPIPLVQIEAYARSPAPVVRAEPERILTQLDSPDPKVRDAAYRLVARTWGVDVPYRATWNARARAQAVQAIRTQVASQ